MRRGEGGGVKGGADKMAARVVVVVVAGVLDGVEVIAGDVLGVCGDCCSSSCFCRKGKGHD